MTEPTPEEYAIAETTQPLRIIVLPAGWCREKPFGRNAVYLRADGLRVLASTAVERDGKRWAHVSLSFARHLPAYADLCDCKDIFIGRNSKAIQVFAPESEHVNIHPYVLHLWGCLDGDPLPDFRRLGGV